MYRGLCYISALLLAFISIVEYGNSSMDTAIYFMIFAIFSMLVSEYFK